MRLWMHASRLILPKLMQVPSSVRDLTLKSLKDSKTSSTSKLFNKGRLMKKGNVNSRLNNQDYCLSRNRLLKSSSMKNKWKLREQLRESKQKNKLQCRGSLKRSVKLLKPKDKNKRDKLLLNVTDCSVSRCKELSNKELSSKELSSKELKSRELRHAGLKSRG